MRTLGLLLGFTALCIACSSDGDDTPDGSGNGGNASASGSASSGGATNAGGTTGSGAASTTGGASGGTTSGGASAGGASTGGAGGGSSTGGNGNSGGARTQCKRGLAYGGHSKADFATLSPAISWWYNWYFEPDQALRDGSYRDADVEYVPMFHHLGDDFGPDNIIAKMPADSRVLLGFNEPNFKKQANLTAAQAAAAWPDVERVADSLQLSIASPAVNYCGPAGDCWDTDPFSYLDDFFAACSGCRVDHIAFHIYVGCNAGAEHPAQWLRDHVENYKSHFPESEYPQKFWLTEFACDDAKSEAEQQAFLEDAVAYLEQEPRIERYAWFSGRFQDMQFVDLYGADGQLTPLGEAYRDAAQPDSCKR